MDKKIFILVLVYLAMAAQGSEEGDIEKELNGIFYRFWTNKMGKNKFYDVKQKSVEKIASAIKQRGFDYKKEVKIIIHGYTRSAASVWKGFAKAYLAAKKTVNLFVVDWSKIAKLPRYEHASDSVDEVGGRICRHLIKAVLKAKSERRRIHIIGHGLGAYVAGHSVRCLEKKVVKKNCLKDCKNKCKKDSEKHCKEKCEKNGKKNGKNNCKKKCLKNGKKNCKKNCKRACNGRENEEEILLIGRITALDPDARGSNHDLTKNDADVLDVIHTNGGSLSEGCIGKPYPFGHVDFFVNRNREFAKGGFKDQHVPGCNDKKYNHLRDLAQNYDSKGSCSHEAAWKMYWESIIYPKSFESRQCDGWKGYQGFGIGVLFDTCYRYVTDFPLHMGENLEIKKVKFLRLLELTGDGRFFLFTSDGSNGRYSKSGL